VRHDSVYTLPGIWADTDAGSGGFLGYGEGRAVAERSEIREELADRVRRMAEECDMLQGFQVLCEDATGFGALSQALLTELSDEFSNRPALYFSLSRGGLRGWHGPGDVHSPGGAAAWGRGALGRGLAMAQLTGEAALYVPLEAPGRSPWPLLAYDAASPFHASALLAAALEGATTPFRLSTAPSVFGAPTGGVRLSDLTGLLAGGRPGLAALHAAFPAPALPADERELSETLDARVPHPHAAGAHSAASRSRGWPLLTALDGMPTLTPGVEDDKGASLAEALVLRGGRTADGALATTSRAGAALDAVLLRERRRCVQHACVVPMPMAVPLPFPRLFAHGLSRNGVPPALATPAEAPAGAAGASLSGPAPAHGVADVETAPLLVKLRSSRQFEGVVGRVLADVRRAHALPGGQATLDAWGYGGGGGDLDEVCERLAEMAAAYNESDDAFEFL